jgi:transcriptional regulator with XRE-family HTH domain
MKPYRTPVVCHCRKFRKERGWSAAEVCRAADVSEGWYSEIERGSNVTIETALRLASVYEKSMEELWTLKPVHVGGK